MAELMRFRLMWRTPFAFGWLMKTRPDPEVVDGYFRALRADRDVRRDARKVFQAAKPSYTLAAAQKLRTLQRPVLVAWAPEDRFFPFRNGERLARELPDAKLVRIEDSYALVGEDQPDRVAELIAGFVRERIAA